MSEQKGWDTGEPSLSRLLMCAHGNTKPNGPTVLMALGIFTCHGLLLSILRQCLLGGGSSVWCGLAFQDLFGTQHAWVACLALQNNPIVI